MMGLKRIIRQNLALSAIRFRGRWRRDILSHCPCSIWLLLRGVLVACGLPIWRWNTHRRRHVRLYRALKNGALRMPSRIAWRAIEHTCGTNPFIDAQSGENSISVVFRLSVSAVNVLLAVDARTAASFGITVDR
jgi:hypothetical protein